MPPLTEGAPGARWTYTRLVTLHGDGTFEGDTRSGNRAATNNFGVPQAGLVMDKAGKLYGTATMGGVSCPNDRSETCGVAFSVKP